MASTPEAVKKRIIAVLGSRSVGKSSLVHQFIEKHFVDSYYPTIEDTFTKKLYDEFSILSGKHAIGIHGYVFVYSITSRRSFEMVQIIYDKVADFRGVRHIPCVIVGSKSDLDKSRAVDEKEAQALAESWKVFELCLSEIEAETAGAHRTTPSQQVAGRSCTVM
ncbi:rheb small monomeric GTPase RhbA [Coprinopsis sp. MPI-PUGE-AT-0042]|nr:rheb small monomeric GTPase RhbA [Coprinopsis sp. MPI-PUGE-AT-0042]